MTKTALLFLLALAACSAPAKKAAAPLDASVAAPAPRGKPVVLADLDVGLRSLETTWVAEDAVLVTSKLGVLRLRPGGAEEIVFRYPEGVTPADVLAGGDTLAISLGERRAIVSLRTGDVRWLEGTGKLRLSSDGRRLLLGAAAFDVATLAETRRFDGEVLDLSPAGTHVLLKEGDHVVVRDAATGAEVLRRKGPAQTHALGDALAVLGTAKTITVARLDGGAPPKELAAPCRDADAMDDKIDFTAGLLVRHCFDAGLHVVDLAALRVEPAPKLTATSDIQIGPDGDVLIVRQVLEESEYPMMVPKTFVRPRSGKWREVAESERVVVERAGDARVTQDPKQECRLGDAGVTTSELCGGALSPSGRFFAGRVGQVFQILDARTGKAVYRAGDEATAGVQRAMVQGRLHGDTLEVAYWYWTFGSETRIDEENRYRVTKPVPRSTMDAFTTGAGGKKAPAGPPTAVRGAVTFAVEGSGASRALTRTERGATIKRPLEGAIAACHLLGLVDEERTLVVRCGKGGGYDAIYRHDAKTLEPRGVRRVLPGVGIQPGGAPVAFGANTTGLVRGALFDVGTGEPHLRLDAGKDFLLVRDFEGNVQIAGNRTAATTWLRCDDGGRTLAPYERCAAEATLL